MSLCRSRVDNCDLCQLILASFKLEALNQKLVWYKGATAVRQDTLTEETQSLFTNECLKKNFIRVYE